MLFLLYYIGIYLFQLTHGDGVNACPVFHAVGDEQRVAADKDKAAMNNYDLINLRGTAGGGSMNMVEKQTMKSTTMTRNKIRNVEYSEEQVRSNVQGLYDTILQKKAE